MAGRASPTVWTVGDDVRSPRTRKLLSIQEREWLPTEHADHTDLSHKCQERLLNRDGRKGRVCPIPRKAKVDPGQSNGVQSSDLLPCPTSRPLRPLRFKVRAPSPTAGVFLRVVCVVRGQQPRLGFGSWRFWGLTLPACGWGDPGLRLTACVEKPKPVLSPRMIWPRASLESSREPAA